MDEKLKWRIVGRFLTDRAIDSQTMKSTLSAIWRPVKGVTTRNIRYSGITLVGVNTIRCYKYLHNHV